jgi:hypothetical protein
VNGRLLDAWTGRLRRNEVLVVALAVGVIACITFAISDTINWSRGFGYDGLLYGTLAQRFPSIMRGTGLVMMPGVHDPVGLRGAVPGLDSYYAMRWLPSALAWLFMSGSRRSVADVLHAFSALDVLCAVGVAGCWWDVAKRLGVSRSGAVVGVVALLLNLQWRQATYAPVATDMLGLLFGMVAVWCWVRGSALGVFAVMLGSAFTWPSELLMGGIFLLWPFERRAPRGLAAGFSGIAALAAAAVLIAVAYVHHAGWTQDGLPSHSLFLLAIGALAGSGFAYLVIAPAPRGKWLLPSASQRPARVLMIMLAVVVAVVGRHLIAVRPGEDDVGVFGGGLLDSARLPGVFLVAAIGWYGPIILLGTLVWRRTVAAASSLGAGGLVGLELAVLYLLFGESRKTLSFLPMIVLAVVLAIDREWSLSRAEVALFTLLSLFASRIWLAMGTAPPPTDRLLQSWTAQRLGMSTGSLTAPPTYVLQLVLEAAIAVAACHWLQPRRRSPAARR